MSGTKKVAIVTGASQGLGAGIARAYRDAGFAVVGNSRSIRQSSDSDFVAVAGDIADREVAGRIVKTAIDSFGRIDTLVNNAGIFMVKSFTEFSQKDFDDAIRTNVQGFFHITQLSLAQMVKQRSGHLIQITATLARHPIAGVNAALASITKGALDSVTRGLALEYVKSGIRVNQIAPGIIHTPMNGDTSMHEFLAGLSPMNRLGEVSDVVEAAMYLERAGFVTGETLHVDGGWHVGRW
jgi:NAD(P)-dependent dehydrogenase (short-subunit alcohol dehydrogenase family)